METVMNVKEAAPVELGDLLDAGEDAIVILVAGDTRLVAHRAVLADRSPVFAAMFAHNTVEASSGQVAIPDVEGPVLRQLVGFLYCQRAPQLSGTAPQLLAAADKYGVTGLKDLCEQQLAAQLAVDNAAAAAVLALRHSCPNLRQAALAFIRTCAFEVMATQGWADAMLSQPKDLIEVSRLLRDQLTETRAPAATGSSAAAPTAASTASAAGSAVASTAASVTRPTTASAAASPIAASPAASAAASTAAPRQPHSRTPSAAAPPAPPLDLAAVSRLRSLSAEEKGRRLILAAKQGKVSQLRALLAAGADVGARDAGSWENTALHWAAREGHVQAASCLLEAGAQVDARESGQLTPLHLAASSGPAAVVRLLLSWRADVNARDDWGDTPLHRAARGGHAESAAALLEAAADRGTRNNKGKTPLDLARYYNEQRLVQLLS